MKKVGLVGEDPNDSSSIKNLLDRKYKGVFQFHPLVKGIKGYQLDNPKIKRALPIEFVERKCKFVIFIKDLDGFESDSAKVREKVKWFQELDALLNKEGLFLLNIWELEALILSDIDTFNKIYNISHKFTKDPMFVKEPKEYLKNLTSKSKKTYQESHCPGIFEKLEISKLEANCKYFKVFIKELDAKK